MPAQNSLSAILGYVSRYYVDSINVDSLTEAMIPDILKELDPHSVYIPAASLQKSNEHLEGNFEGIGIHFNMETDTIIVVNVLSGGPSSKAGVHPGDRIITVNDSVIAGRNIDQEDAVALLRGKTGSKVMVGIRRAGVDELIPIEITRDKVIIKSIDAAYMITPNTGYIRMNTFAQNTHSEFVEITDDLHAKGMTNMILDLRDNVGGLLDQAIRITGELFADRKLIVYTEGYASPRANQYSKSNGKCGSDSLIVLINESSASASEILAGAVQDHDRGIIIGRRSFGKGLVQSMLNLPDGAGLRLTIARYYTPSGRSIQKHYEHGRQGVDKYYNELRQRSSSGEYENADSIKMPDTTKYFTAKGRIVYGSGGITPDIFVPEDPIAGSVIKILNSKMTKDYVTAFEDRHRDELNAIEELSQLDMFFEKNNPYPEFIRHIQARGFSVPGDSKTQVEMFLKLFISRTTPLADLGVAFVNNKFDRTVRKALEIINTQTADAHV
jgi:carboxyl-terminal processing protease